MDEERMSFQRQKIFREYARFTSTNNTIFSNPWSLQCPSDDDQIRSSSPSLIRMRATLNNTLFPSCAMSVQLGRLNFTARLLSIPEWYVPFLVTRLAWDRNYQVLNLKQVNERRSSCKWGTHVQAMRQWK